MGMFRRHRKLVGWIVATLAALVLGGCIAYAATGDVVVSGTTDHSIYRAARTVTITGTVNGDIFCAAQTVDINAEVFGDVMCAGQTVTVNGTVHGSVRTAGQTVTVGAVIDHSATIAGQDATLTSNARVANDVGAFAQTATIDSVVGRDVRGAGNTLTINNAVGRDVQATVGNKLRLDSGARVGGKVDYSSPRPLLMNGNANVSGGITYHITKHEGRHVHWGRGMLLFHLFWLVCLLTFAMVLVAFFPQQFAACYKLSSKRFGSVLLIGFLAMLVLPALLLALVVSVVGWTLAFALFWAWVLAVLVSAPVAAFFVGRLIMPHEKRAPIIMLVGSLALGAVSLIPIIGWIVTMLAIWYGTGSILHYLRSLYKKPQYTV